MDPLLKDLLQTGFSFFVAGYLLVKYPSTTKELRYSVEVLTREVREMKQMLALLVDLLSHRGPSS